MKQFRKMLALLYLHCLFFVPMFQ